MVYQIIRFIANKPIGYDNEKLLATVSVLHSCEDKNEAQEKLNKLFQSVKNKSMLPIKKTKTFLRCENGLHKYLFKIVSKNKANLNENVYL